AYYEDFHLGHANNRVRVDFRREVNFDFCTPQYASKCREAITDNVFPAIDEAVRRARAARDQAPADSERRSAWSALHDRFKAMKNWYRTQRNVAAWVEGVHGYIEATDEAEKQRCRELTRQTVLDEKENARDLLEHIRSVGIDWMVHSDVSETTF